jgi:hypothetical protein
MNDPNVVIIGPKNILMYENHVCRRGWQWSFMGTDPYLRETIINILGKDNRYCYAKELQNLCLEQKEPFLNWIGTVGERQNNIIWWATNTAYKSAYVSDIFLNYCSLMLIRKWINQDIVKRRIIVVENPWLLKSCLLNFKNDKYVYIVRNYRFFIKNLIKQYAFALIRVILFLTRSLNRWFINKFYSLKYRKLISNKLKNKIDVLICTWIEDRSFKGKENGFSDPYLGNLRDYYVKKGLKVFFLNTPFMSLHVLKKVYQCGEIIPSLYFLRLSDIVKSFFKILFFRWRREIPTASGFNVTPLIEYEMLIEKGRLPYIILTYLIWLKLFKNTKLSFNAIIFPFENQPWDKMMVLAKRQQQAKWRLIGYQHTTIPQLDLKYFLGQGERDFSPQPDYIVSNGKYWESILKDAGFTCPIKNGGSLRYTLSSSPVKARITSIPEGRKKNVLVLLSTSLAYSLDLIHYLLRSSNGDKRFLLRPHPDTPEAVILKYIKEFPNNFTFVGGSMSDSIKQVGSAIHIGTTAAIECMMEGIPVYKYIPERIDMDPLLAMNLKQGTITDGDGLNLDDIGDVELPDKDVIAEPFNEETWESILK